MINIKPVSKTENGEVDVYFDLTLVVNKNNELFVVDNSQHDWKDCVDCSTLTVEHIKIHP